LVGGWAGWGARQEKKEKGKSGEGKEHGKKNRGQGQPQQKDSKKTGKEKRLEEKAAASCTTRKISLQSQYSFQSLLPMGLILSEPVKNVVKISKISVKMSVEDEETHPKAKKVDAKGRRSRQKEVGEKTKRKRKVRPTAKTWEEKRCFGWGPLFFPALVGGGWACSLQVAPFFPPHYPPPPPSSLPVVSPPFSSSSFLLHDSVQFRKNISQAPPGRRCWTVCNIRSV
jgi:hypothetical protein